MITDNPGRSWFALITGHSAPHAWQADLIGAEIRDRLIRIPTGMGKTEGVIAAWSRHRILNQDPRWPLRLVWCLPMRVLVEQTEQVARSLVARMPPESRPEVCVAMGGQDAGEWFLYPERPSIVIGTQDMLLSRALNRGYGSGRARWPVEFGLLNHDALWVMDEVQLMDVGLATSAQLQAFRQEDVERGLRPCHTWWMSATLQPEWLLSVDTRSHHDGWISQPCQTTPKQRTGPLWSASKSLEQTAIDQQDAPGFARKILQAHQQSETGENGRITLVVCNTVDRACDTFRALRPLAGNQDICLIHSRFRNADREQWRTKFLSRSACASGVDRIIISTQVVEAGVDISATTLITELAPWSSLVQRFGRCARYGGNGKVVVVDRGLDDKSARPYEASDLRSAATALTTLRDVGIVHLEEFEEALTAEGRLALYPYDPEHLLMRQEFDELFDTTPDLSGADLDISRFIRTGDERDLLVFWLSVPPKNAPPSDRQPDRRELCAVPFLKAREWLCGEETKSNRKPKLKNRIRAWAWDWLNGEWVTADRSSLTPGRIVCVDADSGGYSAEFGFDATSNAAVIGISAPSVFPSPKVEEQKAAENDTRHDTEALSASQWKTIGTHGREVADLAGELARQLSLSPQIRSCLEIAGHWHDRGKAHAAFQGAIAHPDRPSRNDLAKAPDDAWLRPPGTYRLPDGESRPGLRHEFVSVLAMFALLEEYAPEHPALLGHWAEALGHLGQRVPDAREIFPNCAAFLEIVACSAEEFDLIAYLVASHHGKVRTSLHAAPKDQDYIDRDGHGMPIRGVREGDQLSAIGDADESSWPAAVLTLEPASMGLSPRTGASWQDRVSGLLANFGPSAMAYLEAVLRAADVRASRLETPDPALTEVPLI